MKLSPNKAFTLIELLVVISIIGMLASLVLAAMGKVRDKGEIAAGLKFATYNFRGLGADALVYWDFNDPQTSLTTDFSGNNFTGELKFYSSGSVIKESDSPIGYGNSVKFTGASGGGAVEYTIPGNGIDFSNNGVGLKKYTVSAWVKLAPGTEVDNSYGMIVLNAGDKPNNLENAITCGTDIRCINLDLKYITQDGWVVTYGSQDMLGEWGGQHIKIDLVTNRWYHIAYTWNGSIFILYRNGREWHRTEEKTRSCSYQTCFIRKISVGRHIVGDDSPSNDTYFKGNIDDVAIYTSSLAASDIEYIYASGLPTHTLVKE